MKFVLHKVLDARDDSNGLAGGLRRDTFLTYACIRHGVDQSFLLVSKYLREMFVCEAKASQHSGHDTRRCAASGVQKLLVAGSEEEDRNLSLIVGSSKRNELARPGFLTAHFLNHEQRQSRTRAASDSGRAPWSGRPWSSAPAFSGATDFRD